VRRWRVPLAIFACGAGLEALAFLSPVSDRNCLIEPCAAGLWLVVTPITLLPLVVGIVLPLRIARTHLGKMPWVCSLPVLLAFVGAAPSSGSDDAVIVALTGLLLFVVGLGSSFLLARLGIVIRER